MRASIVLRLLETGLLAALFACDRAVPPPASHERSSHAEAGEHAKQVRVMLTIAQIQAAGIGLDEVRAQDIRESLSLYGIVVPNAERVREVTARYPGIIRSVAQRVGEPVRQGDTLATVESNESLETYAVIAPLSGVITARNANPGEQTGDKPLFTVADLSSVWVELSLFPRDVAKVRVGQEVSVQSADREPSAQGKVVYLAPFGSAANQTLNARVLLDNTERKWPPGLYVTAEVTLATTSVPIAVRKTALQTLEDRNVVFVLADAGFEPRSVQTARSDSEFVEVTAGLRAGERYATTNSFVLKAEIAKGEADDGH